MPTTLPSPFDVLPMVAFEVDRGLIASAVTGGSALMERSGIGNGSDIALLHPTLVEPLREAIGGRSVRRRVVIAGTPMLLDAQPHDEGALGLLLALDESRADATDLTERQLEILNLLCLGLASREIGRRLWIAETTVENHLRGIYRRLGCSTRSEAVSRAFRLGLVDAAVLDAVDQPA